MPSRNSTTQNQEPAENAGSPAQGIDALEQAALASIGHGADQDAGGVSSQHVEAEALSQALQQEGYRPPIQRIGEPKERRIRREGRIDRDRDRDDDRYSDRGRGRRRRATTTADPVEIGMNMAKQLRQQELEDRFERQQRNSRTRNQDGTVREGERRGALRPVRAFDMRAFDLPDTTVIADSKGEPVNLQGLVCRWVREVDHLERPTQQRVAEFRHYGYQVVMDPYTNEPIRSHLGVAMAGPPEGYAARVLRNMPEGALSRDDLMRSTYQAVDDINEKANGEVCRLVEGRQHGRTRVETVDRQMTRQLRGGDYDDEE